MIQRIRTRLAGLVAATVIALAPQAEAGEGVLVELFTSQGCSSCPPADQLLGKLAARGDVVALSLHVNYWDYLGWKDSFAHDDFVLRQYAYRDAWDARVVYTPQIVVQGEHDVAPQGRSAIGRVIDRVAARIGMAIGFEETGSGLTAKLMPGSGGGQVILARYSRSETVAIGRGENRGETITYHNVVRELRSLGDWDGVAATSFDIPMPGVGEGVALWVQEGRAGPVRAAAKYER